MCKHIVNAQVYICSPCCNKWFECAECHDEHVRLHHFKTSKNLRLTCKKCKNCFNRDLQIFSQRDKHCDYCGNLWVLPGVTPESLAFVECRDVIDEALAKLLEASDEFFATIE